MADDELEEFRRAWKNELETSRASTGLGKEVQTRREASPARSKARADLLARRPPPAAATPSNQPAPTNPTPAATSDAAPATSSSLKATSAVELYSDAVQAEQQGRLNEALKGYRAAFRLDDKVDRAYHRQQASSGQKQGEGRKVYDDVAVEDLDFEFQRTLQLEPDYERQKQLKGRMLTASYVDKLSKSFHSRPCNPAIGQHAEETARSENHPSEITFHPRNKSRGVPITKLPDELLLYILSFFSAPSPHAQYPDVRSIERGFSLTCRKARLVTIQSLALWKDMCTAVYKPPLQIETTSTSAAALAVKLYSNDWRLMWIEHPRIRTDGVYISQITYVRRGAQDGSSYYDPTHLVTYYRYLCFLPSGDVVSLLSHDIPALVVPTLLSSSHASSKPQAGYTVGRWRLRHPANDESTTLVQLSSLEDPRISKAEDVKYSFKMICRLKSTARGRMNKLEMVSLTAKNHRTEEESPIPLRSGPALGTQSMPTFYFSRVLSYD